MNFAEFLVGFGAQVAQEVRTDNPIADGYVRAVARLMQHASRWAAVSASGIVCSTRFRNPIGEVSVCGAAGIGACVACGSPTCIGHAMISPTDGNLICFGCVGAAERVAKDKGWAPPPPRSSETGPTCSCKHPWTPDKNCVLHGARNREEQRRKYLRVLGLKEDAAWPEIQQAYRKLAQKYHPDKASNSGKAGAQKRMAKINVAFGWLKDQREKEAA